MCCEVGAPAGYCPILLRYIKGTLIWIFDFLLFLNLISEWLHGTTAFILNVSELFWHLFVQRLVGCFLIALSEVFSNCKMRAGFLSHRLYSEKKELLPGIDFLPTKMKNTFNYCCMV